MGLFYAENCKFQDSAIIAAKAPASESGRYKTGCASDGFLLVAAEECDDFAAQLADSF